MLKNVVFKITLHNRSDDWLLLSSASHWKKWYIDFYAFDPVLGEMRRKKFMLNGIKSPRERKRKATELLEALMHQLRDGWNPWVNAQESRGFTLLSDCLTRYTVYGIYRTEIAD